MLDTNYWIRWILALPKLATRTLINEDCNWGTPLSLSCSGLGIITRALTIGSA